VNPRSLRYLHTTTTTAGTIAASTETKRAANDDGCPHPRGRYPEVNLLVSVRIPTVVRSIPTATLSTLVGKVVPVSTENDRKKLPAMPAPVIPTKSDFAEIHGIDTETGYLVDVDGAFLGVDPAITASKHKLFIAAATAAARLLRARPSAGTATVWSRSHQRLWDAMNIDLRQLRGHVHHDATRRLRDAIDQARVERRLRENGQPLPPRNAVYLKALASEIRLAERSVAALAA